MTVAADPNDPSGVSGEATTGGAARSRSRALLFTILSGLWVFPSLGAFWILWSGSAPWQTSLTVEERMQAMSLEQWCAVALLLTHGVFVMLALHFRHTKPSGQTGSR